MVNSGEFLERVKHLTQSNSLGQRHVSFSFVLAFSEYRNVTWKNVLISFG